MQLITSTVYACMRTCCSHKHTARFTAALVWIVFHSQRFQSWPVMSLLALARMRPARGAAEVHASESKFESHDSCDWHASRLVEPMLRQPASGTQPYNKSADVFSFGVVLWELVTLQVPWRKAGGVQSSLSESGSEGEDRFDGVSDPTMYRDPFFHVLKEVPSGTRLPFPEPSTEKPLEELHRVSAGCCHQLS